jgi:hypothetical protein
LDYFFSIGSSSFFIIKASFLNELNILIHVEKITAEGTRYTNIILTSKPAGVMWYFREIKNIKIVPVMLVRHANNNCFCFIETPPKNNL